VSSITMKSILEAAADGRTSEALAGTNALLGAHPDCPYLLVWQAILIQVQGPDSTQTLDDAEASLIRAHTIDPNYLPALEELAHFYDAVKCNREKAREFASRYIQRSQKIVNNLRTIIDTPA